MRVPVSTPAGTLILIVRRVRTRPSPEHSKQGLTSTSPKPWQVMQGRVVMTWPRNERCTCWISPRPPQTSQVRRPGARLGAVAVARGAQHRGLDGELLLGTEHRVREVDVESYQRVLATALA